MDHGPVLPQELFDLVIDHLHDDPRSLRACAVVSTSFLPPSRVHLFSHIRIGHLDQERSIKELHTILAKSSGVAARVESLHFWDDMMRHHSWLEGNLELAPAVAHFLRILPSLQRFCITINAGFVHWANMATILRTSVYKTIVLPTLTRVELTGLYGLPFALFANCTALKSVTLKWVTFHERDNLDFAATLAACVGSPPAQLEHLSLALDARLLGLLSQWIINPQSPLDITLLKSFSCILDGPTDHVALGSLLAVCASTLETLQLKNQRASQLRGTYKAAYPAPPRGRPAMDPTLRATWPIPRRRNRL
ncbi:hypothetical protein B0H15DRAFT_22580 [Mycena belliarum]|uniref:Uncharacterized protein n=1 Tax=Mycena belliarum TaxID=1033014 RepID=A0AAD6XUZ6_9AGAR|nr:hypothetical protein B0H15DRAFT_22580 [Mycena belliae]